MSVLTLIGTVAGVYRDVIEPSFKDGGKPPPAAAKASARPSYSGEIGHYSKGVDFLQFIHQNEGEIVDLDCWFLRGAVDVEPAENDVPERFLLDAPGHVSFDDDGEEFTEGEYSDNLGEGLQVLIEESKATDSLWGWNSGVYYLKGLYSITRVPGTNFGVFTVRLRPVAKEHMR